MRCHFRIVGEEKNWDEGTLQTTESPYWAIFGGTSGKTTILCRPQFFVFEDRMVVSGFVCLESGDPSFRLLNIQMVFNKDQIPREDS